MSDLRLKIGTTLRMRVRRTDSSGLPRDLSGLTVTSALRREVGGQTYQLSVDTSEASAGVLVIGASAAETATWPAGRYLWDIKYTDATGVAVADPVSTNLVVTVIPGATP